MYLVNLIYASKTKDAYLSDVRQILLSSQANNQKNNITGMLYFNEHYFLQSLEGSREKVNLTYNKIIQDPRHEDPIILHYDVIQKRNFQDWNMSCVYHENLAQDSFLKYSIDKNFNPYAMCGQSANLLLKDLSNWTTPIIESSFEIDLAPAEGAIA